MKDSQTVLKIVGLFLRLASKRRLDLKSEMVLEGSHMHVESVRDPGTNVWGLVSRTQLVS